MRKPRKQLVLILAMAGKLMGCAHGPPIPPTGPEDTLVYFTLQLDELPGRFVKAVLFSPDKTFAVGTAWANPMQEKPLTIVCYVDLPHDKPFYLGELHGRATGIFSGGKYEIFAMSPQFSPVKVRATSQGGGLHYGGAFRFHRINKGIFHDDQFQLLPCPDCPRERDAVANLVAWGEKKHGGLLEQNHYLDKLRARLAKKSP